MDATKLIIVLVIILLAGFPGGMKSIFPGGGTAADEITEIEDPNYDEMGIFPLDEEGSPARGTGRGSPVHTGRRKRDQHDVGLSDRVPLRGWDVPRGDGCFRPAARGTRAAIRCRSEGGRSV